MANENQEKLETNDEILYRVNERNPVYIFGDIFLVISFIFISFIAFSSDKIIYDILGILFLLFAFYIFIALTTFNELIIYKDRVEIDRKFFGISIIKINEIKHVLVNGRFFSEWLFFQLKNSRFSHFKYLITSLRIEDEYEIQQIINDLIKGERQ